MEAAASPRIISSTERRLKKRKPSNKTTGQTIATMLNTKCPVSMESVILQPPVVLPVGTKITVRSTYQRHPTKTWEAMGILHAFGVIN